MPGPPRAPIRGPMDRATPDAFKRIAESPPRCIQTLGRGSNKLEADSFARPIGRNGSQKGFDSNQPGFH